ncbi:MAG: flagellar hook-length control protein FliK [Allosphingosinicella sp.]
MASAPNMRLVSTERPGLKDQPAESAEGDDFAQLMCGLPTPARGASVKTSECPPVAAKADEDDEAESSLTDLDAILSLVALPVPLPATVSPATPAPAAPTPTGTVPTSLPLAAQAALAGATTGTTALTAGAAAAAAVDPAATAVDPAVTAVDPAAAPALKAVLASLGTAAEAPVAKAGAAKLARFSRAPAIPTEPTGEPKAGIEGEPAAPKGKAVPSDILPSAGQRTAAVLQAIAARSEAGTSEPRRREGRLSATFGATSKTSEASATPSTNVQAPIPSFTFAPPSAGTAPAAASIATGPAATAGAPEMMIERHLDLAADGEWLDQLTRDITSSGGSEGRMSFRLNPENLGRLLVELSRGDQGTTVRLTADSEAARAMLADAQPKLIAEARAQGLRIAETHVDLAGGQAGDPRRQQTERPDPLIRTAGDHSVDEPGPHPRTGSSSDRFA